MRTPEQVAQTIMDAIARPGAPLVPNSVDTAIARAGMIEALRWAADNAEYIGGIYYVSLMAVTQKLLELEEL